MRESAPDNVVIVVCGNKLDLKEDAEVSEAQGLEFAERFMTDGHFQVSAKTDTGVLEMMTGIAEECHARFKNLLDTSSRTSSF